MLPVLVFQGEGDAPCCLEHTEQMLPHNLRPLLPALAESAALQAAVGSNYKGLTLPALTGCSLSSYAGSQNVYWSASVAQPQI